MKTASSIVDELRIGVPMSDEQDAQIMYEQWLKHDQWAARENALPLVVGCEPGNWRAYVDAQNLQASEETLWHILANDLGIEPNDSISINTLVEWTRSQSITMHPSFLRIYEFVRKVLLASSPPQPKAEDFGEPADNHSAHEREIVVGAALSLLSKMPAECRDENGFADGAAIVALINKTAARWFPTSAPAMSEQEMSDLIDKWLE